MILVGERPVPSIQPRTVAVVSAAASGCYEVNQKVSAARTKIPCASTSPDEVVPLFLPTSHQYSYW